MSNFAPAFGRKKRQRDEDEDFAAIPTYARDNERPAGTWSTYIPATGQVTYDAQWNAGHRDDGRLWVDQPVNQAGDGSSDDQTFDDRFVRDEDLLRQRPRDAFQARNQSVLSMNINYSNIQTAYGGVAISFDGRGSSLNADGSYKDPSMQGQVKKRVVKAFKRAYNEREKEKALWREKMDRWNALADEVKERKRAENRNRFQAMMEHFQVQIVEKSPEEYDGGAFELGGLGEALDETDDAASAASPTSPSSTATRQSSGTSQGPSNHDAASYWPLVEAQYNSPGQSTSPAPSKQSSLHSPAPSSSYSRSSNGRGQRRQHRGGHDLHRSIETLSPSYGSLATPTTVGFHKFTVTHRPRHTPGSFARPPSMAPIPQPLSVATRFEVINHPDYEVFEDVEVPANAQQVRDREAKVDRIMDLSNRKGRLVTIRLPDEIKLSFAEAICDRLFGGMVQELKFDPDTRHAVICFLTPVAASAFVRHVWNTRHNSQHEYRRLEIAAMFYGDNEISAVYPAQNNIVRAVVYENASRVLIVTGVAKTLDLRTVNHAMKAGIGLERLIVKGRLVVPVKLYEKNAGEYTNSLILEMSSIKDAIEVKSMINQEGLKDFPEAKAEYYKDPVDAPAVEKAFCDCKYCKGQRAAH